MSMHEDADKFMTAEDTRAPAIAIILAIVVPCLAAFLAGLL
jgi:hypothetical protein